MGSLPAKAQRIAQAAYSSALAQGASPRRAKDAARDAVRKRYVVRDGRVVLRNPTPKTGEGRLLKRPPIGSIDGKACAELGMLLEVATDRLVFRFPKGKVPLCWFPELGALIGVQGAQRGRKTRPDEVEASAASAYERWSDRGVRAERTDKIRFGKAQWRTFGRVKRVDYYSDKWGKRDEYTHDTGKSVKLYRFGGSAPPYLWVVKGRTLRVTTRGLVG